MALGKSLRFQENVIDGDELADSPFTVPCDLKNVLTWEKTGGISEKKYRGGSVRGIFFFI